MNRRGRFALFVAILLLGACTMTVNAFIEAWSWKSLLVVLGLLFVALLNVLAAAVAPWHCPKCKHVWRRAKSASD